MRVLHIDTGAAMRGGQWQVLYLLRGLRGRGHPCTLLARSGSPLFRAAVAEGFETMPASLAALVRARGSCDLIHAHDARGHTLAALAGRGPLIVARRVAFGVRSDRLSRWKYARATRYLAVSRHVRVRLLEAGIDETRVRVVYDGVPVLEPAPAGGRVLAPASDDPRKGSALAREAAALAEVPLTFSSDLARELPGSRLFLYLSQQEGLGSAVLLAMSAGVPVVASAAGGLREIVQDGVTGLLAGDTAATVAIRMRRLLEDPALCSALAEAARRQVLERFTVDRMVEGTLEAYREAAG